MIATKEHGCLGENLKVHFAGSENYDFSYVLHDSGVKYILFTVLPFIRDKFGIKWGHFTNAKKHFAYEELPKIGKHVIMDSGLFTLMFGACKDLKPDEKFIRRYKDAIVDFVKEHELFSITCLLECIIGIADTPFLYLARALKHGDEEDV